MAEFLIPQRATLIRRDCTLDECLPPGHLVRFVWRILESFDFAEIEVAYASVHQGPGRPPYHPRVLAALWIYGMTQGMETAAEIARAATKSDDFRWLAGGLTPCDQTFLNFLTVAKEGIVFIWEQVLRGMHEAGHIDLSALAEDGTKLRADASRRSFHTADDIAAVIEDLKARLARKIEELVPSESVRRHQAQVRVLKDRLQRAEQAVQELQARVERRSRRKSEAPAGLVLEGCPENSPGAPRRRPPPGQFGRGDFRYDPERDVWRCPADQDLRLVGTYPTDNGQGAYRLYERADCQGCPLKVNCTQAKGRRLKAPVVGTPIKPPPSGVPALASPELSPAPSAGESALPPHPDPKHDEPEGRGPQASLTDPEAVLMLATSEKRFAPSYNADLTVTRHGIIVNQFLTKEPVDFGHFRRALPTVLARLGRPQAWIGDGQYNTLENLVLADQAGILLYAPLDETPATPNEKFSPEAFRHDSSKDVLVCPAGQELPKTGTYGWQEGRPYDLYTRSDCSGCPQKSLCTDARGRRVKRFHSHPLTHALQVRMKDVGEQTRRFRGQTVEPVNAQIKQHGVGRFHVRGLPRCGTVLTLACIAHDLMKWNAREAARILRRAS